MADYDEPEPEQEPRTGMRTQCYTCRGEGVVVVARMAVINGQFGSAPEVKSCPGCDGGGWLPVFVMPA
jgi:DnaJ-class molecular chaperone